MLNLLCNRTHHRAVCTHSPGSLVVKEKDKEEFFSCLRSPLLPQLQHIHGGHRDGDPVVEQTLTWHLGVDYLGHRERTLSTKPFQAMNRMHCLFWSFSISKLDKLSLLWVGKQDCLFSVSLKKFQPEASPVGGKPVSPKAWHPILKKGCKCVALCACKCIYTDV